MVAIVSRSFQRRSHLACLIHISTVCGVLSLHLCHQRIACNSHNGLYRKVYVVGQMSCKVVGAKLVGRVLPVSYQIVCPHRKQVPILLGKVGLSFSQTGHCREYNHISGLFHRHVLAKIALGTWETRGIHLLVGNGIETQIVCREMKSPARAVGAILEYAL